MEMRPHLKGFLLTPIEIRILKLFHFVFKNFSFSLLVVLGQKPLLRQLLVVALSNSATGCQSWPTLSDI